MQPEQQPEPAKEQATPEAAKPATESAAKDPQSSQQAAETTTPEQPKGEHTENEANNPAHEQPLKDSGNIFWYSMGVIIFVLMVLALTARFG